MKNCKRRTIFSWLFAFVLLIPMFSIAVRCLYVVINKNAYQSYSELNENSETYINNQESININNKYRFIMNNEYAANSTIYYVNGIQNVNGTNNTTFLNTLNDITSFQAYYNNNQNIRSLRYYLNNEPTTYYLYETKISFDFNSLNNFNTNVTDKQLCYLINIETDKALDNVFEYSIQLFVDKHGNGLINFFALLQDYFMQSTSANALYFTFANWCLNYILLVSCVWLLFSVLMWFINYCNYMLNTSFRKGHGD